MLEENEIDYTYREYTEDPLSIAEIKSVLLKLNLSVFDVLRKNDKAYKELQLQGEESSDQLIRLMATHPTLLQRPLAVLGDRARLGRPVDHLLDLIA